MAKKHTILIAIFVNSVFLITLFSLAIQKNRNKQEFHVVQREENLTNSSPTVITNDLPDPILDDFSSLSIHGELELEQGMEPPISVSEIKVELLNANQPQQYIELFVKRGDDISRLAQKYGVSVKEILEASHLTNAQLRIGQKLKIPNIEGFSDHQPVKEEFYTIEQGDTLHLIASKYKVEVSDLLKFNDLDGDRAKLLRLGDRIRVR